MSPSAKRPSRLADRTSHWTIRTIAHPWQISLSERGVGKLEQKVKISQVIRSPIKKKKPFGESYRKFFLRILVPFLECYPYISRFHGDFSGWSIIAESWEHMF